MNLPGEPTHEGHLERKNQNQKWWKEYYVVLKGGQLFFYNKDNCQNLFGALELSTLGTFCEPEKGLLTRGYQFSVATPSTVTYLRASTADNRDQWIKSIMAAVTGIGQPQTANRPVSSQGSSRHHSIPTPVHEPQVYDSTLLVHVDHEWYWPGKTREQAEQLLREQLGNCFLVRDSESSVGAYSLSVGVGPIESKNLLHYIIQKTGDLYILNPAPNERFSSLKEVVDYYVGINKSIISPLKNPAYQLQQQSLLQAQQANAAQQVNAANLYTKEPATQENLSYVDPGATSMTINPHSPALKPVDKKGGARGGSKRTSVGDLLEEEFERLDDNGDRMSSYKQAVTQGEKARQEEETEYVRLGGFPLTVACERTASKKGAGPPEDLDENSPQKPPRPNQGGHSEYMNVHTHYKDQGQVEGSKVVLQGQGGDKGNYIYAAISTNNNVTNGNVPQPKNDNAGEAIIIRGDERNTPAVTRFGQGGASMSMFEDPQDNSCYVNFDLNNQMSANCNVAEPAKPLKMSKASAKAGAKNKGNKKTSSKSNGPNVAGKPSHLSTHSYRDYRTAVEEYPVASGPIGYTDPAVSMSQPPPKIVRGANVEEYPIAAGPTGYTDPCMSMAKPPSVKSHRGTVEEYPVASGPISYTDPCMTSMAKAPSHGKSSPRQGSNV